MSPPKNGAVQRARQRLLSEIASSAHCRGRAEFYDGIRAQLLADGRLTDEHNKESDRKWELVDAADKRVETAISAYARAIRREGRTK